jgi:hypothetical protein
VAKASTLSSTNSANNSSIGVQLDTADRKAVILACCNQLFLLGFKHDIGAWRAKAASLDFYELLYKAQELGVTLKQGNQPYTLPRTITHR